MSCPTCDHTMQAVFETAMYHCPRCGTLRLKRLDGSVDDRQPELVKRIHDAIEQIGLDPTEGPHETLIRCGVEECIYPPPDRSLTCG